MELVTLLRNRKTTKTHKTSTFFHFRKHKVTALPLAWETPFKTNNNDGFPNPFICSVYQTNACNLDAITDN